MCILLRDTWLCCAGEGQEQLGWHLGLGHCAGWEVGEVCEWLTKQQAETRAQEDLERGGRGEVKATDA